MEQSSSAQKFAKIAIYAIIIAVLLNLTTGIQNVWSLLGKQMTADYGWSTVEATRPYSILTLASGIFSIVAGRVGDKYGHRIPILFGGMMMGLGLLFSSMHQSAWLMCITAGLMLGLSSSSITCNTAGNSIQWSPPKYKGLVSGIITSGFALSSLYMTPLIKGAMAKIGMMNTFRFGGVLAIVIIWALAFLLPDTKSKKHYDQAMKISSNVGAEGTAAAAVDHSKYKNTVSPNQALLKWEFWAAWLLYLTGCMGGQVFISQAVTIASVQSPGWTDASILVMLLALSNFCGRLVWPGLSDRVGTFTVTKIMMAIQGVNWLLFSVYKTPTTLIFGCMVLGFTFGGNIPMLWNWLGSTFGTKNISALQGMGTTAWAVGGMVGPLAAASIMDRTGGYGSAFIVMGVLCFVAFGLAFTLKDSYDDDPKAVQVDVPQ